MILLHFIFLFRIAGKHMIIASANGVYNLDILIRGNEGVPILVG